MFKVVEDEQTALMGRDRMPDQLSGAFLGVPQWKLSLQFHHERSCDVFRSLRCAQVAEHDVLGGKKRFKTPRYFLSKACFSDSRRARDGDDATATVEQFKAAVELYLSAHERN